jgi:hypothetical protein
MSLPPWYFSPLVPKASHDVLTDSTGTLEIDEDYFEVWPNDPDPDTEEARIENPGGFIWDCCQERGDGKEGCVRDRHDSWDAKRQK